MIYIIKVIMLIIYILGMFVMNAVCYYLDRSKNTIRTMVLFWPIIGVILLIMYLFSNDDL